MPVLPDSFIYFVFAFLGVIFGGMIAIIFYMRKRHAQEVYAIWLVVSFFFTIFLAMDVAVHIFKFDTKEICGPNGERCTQVYKMLTDPEGELTFVIIFIVVTVTPQILAYGLSALSGSASAPRYVWTIQQAAAWSLIKFVAGVGGIFTALLTAILVAGRNVEFQAIVGPVLIAVAFWLAFFNLGFWDAWDFFRGRYFSNEKPKRLPIRILVAIHQWCTRNVPKEPPRSITRTALIAALESDLIYDYMLQDIQHAKSLEARDPPLGNSTSSSNISPRELAEGNNEAR